MRCRYAWQVYSVRLVLKDMKLCSDPLGTFNVTPSGIGECLLTVQNYKLPMLVLGGGGYHKVDAPKCFATLTSMLLDMHLPEDIPEHEYFEMLGNNS